MCRDVISNWIYPRVLPGTAPPGRGIRDGILPIRVKKMF